METQIDYWQAHALLDWQIDLGVDEAICETPINRYELAEKTAKTGAPAQAKAASLAPPPAPEVSPVDEAHKAAQAATSLPELQQALENFDHCAFKQGSKKLVFSDGYAGAKVMVIGNPPRRDEDAQGRPFVGAQGDLFDQMFAAIGLSRQSEEAQTGLYAACTIPWRPPENRDPSAEEMAMMKPFLLRHIALKKPEVLVLMGNWACASVLGKAGVRRLRGSWQNANGIHTMPMLHPEDLLRTPMAKRDAWADLLEIKARLAAQP